MKKIVSLLLAAMVVMCAPAAALSGSAAVCGVSAIVQAAETLDTPDKANPDTLDYAETSEQPCSSDQPCGNVPGSTPDAAETEDTSETEDTPDTSDVPGKETADQPSLPDTVDQPEPEPEPEPEPQPEPEPLPQPKPEPVKDNTPQGDVNGDKQVTSEDALLVLRYSVGFYHAIPKNYRKYADMNGDKMVNSSDAIEILRKTVAVDGVLIRSKSTESTKQDSTVRDDSALRYGIDVSMWQGSIDFKKVKASGVSFVIIRAGYGRYASQKDEWFEENYRRAKAAGLDVGVYWYSYAVSADDARQEARACISAISGKRFEYPIYFDLEESWQIRQGMSFCSSLVSAFCSEVEAHGYYSGFYSSTSVANNVVSYDVQSRYAYWAAEWGSSVHYYNQYGMWQYSDAGIINGIGGYVDLDVAYINYPAVIKEFHLNGY